MQDFRKLKVWQDAQNLTFYIYKISKKKTFFDEEKYGLVQQIRRASTSICLNIAEGAGSISQAKFAYYLHNAIASCNEVECCLILLKKLGYCNEEDINLVYNNSQKLGKMLNSLIRKVKQTSNQQLETENQSHKR